LSLLRSPWEGGEKGKKKQVLMVFFVGDIQQVSEQDGNYSLYHLKGGYP
jgi:hypothetical protein